MNSIHYNEYHFTVKETIIYISAGTAVIGCVSFLFYRSVYAFLIGMSLMVPYLKTKRNTCIKRRRERLTLQFRDGITAFSNALSVGYSIENAWKEAYKDMQLLHDENADIMVEFAGMIRQMDSNAVFENLLLDFAKRSGVPDIMDFAEVFAVAKRSGGNLHTMIQECVTAISDKIEVRREIQVSLSARLYEQRIMNVIPMAIIAYISISSPHYFDVLYHNVAGIAIMTLCLILYGAGIYLSGRMLRGTMDML